MADTLKKWLGDHSLLGSIIIVSLGISIIVGIPVMIIKLFSLVIFSLFIASIIGIFALIVIVDTMKRSIELNFGCRSDKELTKYSD